MKLRYRTDVNGYYVPQFLNKKTEEWEDIKVKELSPKAAGLAKQLANLQFFTQKWHTVYHYTPQKGENKGDQSLIFEFEYLVNAFLSGLLILYSSEVKEINVI